MRRAAASTSATTSSNGSQAQAQRKQGTTAASATAGTTSSSKTPVTPEPSTSRLAWPSSSSIARNVDDLREDGDTSEHVQLSGRTSPQRPPRHHHLKRPPTPEPRYLPSSRAQNDETPRNGSDLGVRGQGDGAVQQRARSSSFSEATPRPGLKVLASTSSTSVHTRSSGRESPGGFSFGRNKEKDKDKDKDKESTLNKGARSVAATMAAIAVGASIPGGGSGGGSNNAGSGTGGGGGGSGDRSGPGSAVPSRSASFSTIGGASTTKSPFRPPHSSSFTSGLGSSNTMSSSYSVQKSPSLASVNASQYSLGGSTMIGAGGGAPSIKSMSSFDARNMVIAMDKGGTELGGLDDHWQTVCVTVLPLFNDEDHKGYIEDLNKLVSLHIRSTFDRSPAHALSILTNDLSELTATGMLTLSSKLASLNSDKLLSTLTEVWTFFFTFVLPYLEGIFLPFATDKAMISMINKGQANGIGASSSASTREGRGVVGGTAKGIDVRRVALMGFRDNVILPIHDRLKVLFEEIYDPPPNPSSQAVPGQPEFASQHPPTTTTTAAASTSATSFASPFRTSPHLGPPPGYNTQGHAKRLQMVLMLTSLSTDDVEQDLMDGLSQIMRSGNERKNVGGRAGGGPSTYSPSGYVGFPSRGRGLRSMREAYHSPRNHPLQISQETTTSGGEGGGGTSVDFPLPYHIPYRRRGTDASQRSGLTAELESEEDGMGSGSAGAGMGTGFGTEEGGGTMKAKSRSRKGWRRAVADESGTGGGSPGSMANESASEVEQWVKR